MRSKLKPVEDVEITIKPDMIVSSSNGNIPIVSDLDGNAEDVLYGQMNMIGLNGNFM